MQPQLRAQGLCKKYRGRPVVRDVSFVVHAGEVVGLLGPNGAGKSTSFNMVAGLVRPDAGEVWLGAREMGRQPLYKRARLGLGYLPQEPTVFHGLSVRHNFEVVLEHRGTAKSERAPIIDKILADYNLVTVAESLGRQLSGGERRRVEMARTSLAEPTVVLLDEPFAGVDPIAVSEIRGFIRHMRDGGIGILVTDHNVRETLRICDRAYLIADGKILMGGSPAEIVADGEARRLYLGDDFEL